MEWSKDKTLRLIELLQINANLWNPSLCDSRRDKQKRREELHAIASIFGITVSDATKKIQHLRTQYNRESAREARANAEGPNENYISNWYAYEYLHFMKDSNKPYRILTLTDHPELNGNTQQHNMDVSDNKLDHMNTSNISRSELLHSLKPDILYSPQANNRDEYSVFGEYIANELRSLKGEKNLLVAKKKIQDVIFEVKMGMISDQRLEHSATCTVYTTNTQPSVVHNGKLYSSSELNTTIEPQPTNASTNTRINEIMISGSCHYPTFKVDDQ
ncbi:uncharacterized protein LOC121731951 [Aricia agestis]|uniref:uncharacterized protein LOC121731951 n=1 Tax=Aricia agestis TaxID=91739 RepID=UPI001C20AEEC|nr:uncharacterized protein LOC121731951 [Aricia agestis]